MFRKAEPRLRFKAASQPVVSKPITRSDTLSDVLVFNFLRFSTFWFVAQRQEAACCRSFELMCPSVFRVQDFEDAFFFKQKFWIKNFIRDVEMLTYGCQVYIKCTSNISSKRKRGQCFSHQRHAPKFSPIFQINVSCVALYSKLCCSTAIAR
jgi:hypothetical protein